MRQAAPARSIDDFDADLLAGTDRRSFDDGADRLHDAPLSANHFAPVVFGDPQQQHGPAVVFGGADRYLIRLVDDVLDDVLQYGRRALDAVAGFALCLVR